MTYEEPLALAGDFNVIPEPRDAAHPELWAQGRAVPAADARQVPRAVGARLHRRLARDERRGRPLHVLGLSGGRLAEEQRHPHRPPPACRRRRPIGSHRSKSTRTCAAAKRPPITFRCASSSRTREAKTSGPPHDRPDHRARADVQRPFVEIGVRLGELDRIRARRNPPRGRRARRAARASRGPPRAPAAWRASCSGRNASRMTSPPGFNAPTNFGVQRPPLVGDEMEKDQRDDVVSLARPVPGEARRPGRR